MSGMKMKQLAVVAFALSVLAGNGIASAETPITGELPPLPENEIDLVQISRLRSEAAELRQEAREIGGGRSIAEAIRNVNTAFHSELAEAERLEELAQAMGYSLDELRAEQQRILQSEGLEVANFAGGQVKDKAKEEFIKRVSGVLGKAFGLYSAADTVVDLVKRIERWRLRRETAGNLGESVSAVRANWRALNEMLIALYGQMSIEGGKLRRLQEIARRERQIFAEIAELRGETLVRGEPRLDRVGDPEYDNLLMEADQLKFQFRLADLEGRRADAVILRARIATIEETIEELEERPTTIGCGSGFFFIPGTDNCLQIGGAVDYGFHWGGDAEDQFGEQFSGIPGFWDFGVSFEPSLSFGGMQTRGAFATETPAPAQLVVPGYDFDTGFRGAGVKAELSGTISVGGFPLTLGGGIEFNTATATSSATDVAFPEGFGIPGVGPISGAFINSPTDMLQFDFEARRQQLTAFFEGTLPLSEGEFMLAGSRAGYRLGGVIGVRGGSFSQHEMTTAATSSPAFPTPGATSTYETDFTGGFGGVYAGLSLDKNIPFGDDGLSVQEMFSFALGYDRYGLDVTDSIVADGLGGALSLNDTNSFSVSGGFPTVNLDASIGVGTADWMAGMNAGFSVGKTALIEYQRLDDGGNPHTSLLPEIGWTVGASFKGRF